MAVNMAISTIFTAVNKVSTTVKKMTADLGGLGAMAERAKGAVSAVGKVGVGVAKGVGFVAAGAGAAAVGVFKLAESVSNLGDDVAKTARSLGLSADALQEFRYIGERSGVSVEEMDVALKKLTVNVGDATADVAESLAALGITAAAMQKAGPDQALNLVADGMAKIKDPAKRAAIAVDLFGKNGVKMVNVLSEGRTGMAALADEAHRVGYVMDGPTLDASEKLNDMILNMRTSFKALGNQMASKFMPLVTRAVVAITDFLVDNRQVLDDLSDGVIKIFEGLAPIVQTLLPVFASTLKKIGTALSDAFNNPGKTAENFFDVFAKALVFFANNMDVLFSLAVGIKAVSLAMGLLGATNPWILAIGATAALITLIVANWDKISAFFKGVASVNAKEGGSGNVADYGYSGSAVEELYGPAPISSQTSTIERNTRNTLDVNVNNNSGLPVSARATGPAAPPITVRTGSMRGGAR